jgi:uncharacterized protein YjbI with pentapeptide repeats
LANANLQNLILTNTKITHIYLGGASLVGTQLRQDQLGDAIGAVGTLKTGGGISLRQCEQCLERREEERYAFGKSTWPISAV